MYELSCHCWLMAEMLISTWIKLNHIFGDHVNSCLAIRNELWFPSGSYKSSDWLLYYCYCYAGLVLGIQQQSTCTGSGLEEYCIETDRPDRNQEWSRPGTTRGSKKETVMKSGSKSQAMGTRKRQHLDGMGQRDQIQKPGWCKGQEARDQEPTENKV